MEYEPESRVRKYFRIRFEKMMALYVRGWDVCLFLCADNTYYVRLCRDARELQNLINEHHYGIYFSNHPERLPLKLIYLERHLPFLEAYAKYKSIQHRSKYLKDYLLRNKKWFIAWPLRDYLLNKAPIETVERLLPKKIIMENLKKMDKVTFDNKTVKILSYEESKLAKRFGETLKEEESNSCK